MHRLSSFLSFLLLHLLPPLDPPPLRNRPRYQPPRQRLHRQRPPHRADDVMLQPQAQPPPADERAQRARGARHALRDAVHGTQDLGVRDAVVDEDDGRGQREGARDDLQPDDDGEGGPDEPEWGARDQDEEGHEHVRERREGEEGAVASQRAQAELDARVEEDLQRQADDADQGRGEADARRRQPETAAEVEEAAAGAFGGARRGQEDEGHGVEGAGVEGQEEVRRQGQEHVTRPDLAEGRAAAFRSLFFGRRRP